MRTRPPLRHFSPASRLFAFLLLLGGVAGAQQKRPVSHEDYDSWKSVAGTTTDPTGTWVAYSLTPQDGDATLVVRKADGDTTFTHARGTGPRFTEDGRFVVFMIPPPKDEVRAFKRSKLKPAGGAGNPGEGAAEAPGGRPAGARPGAGAGPAGRGQRGPAAGQGAPGGPAAGQDDPDEPKSSLGIMDLATGKLVSPPIARVKSFQVPREGPPVVAWLLEKEPASPASRPRGGAASRPAETGAESAASRPESRSESRPATREQRDPTLDRRKEGTRLVVRNLATDTETRIEGVTAFGMTRKTGWLWFVCSSKKDDPKIAEGLHALDLASGKRTLLCGGTGNYTNVTFDKKETRMAFLSDRDDFKSEKPTTSVYLWDFAAPAAKEIVSHRTTRGFPQARCVSTSRGITFSRDGNVLLVGAGRLPEKDPAPMLDEEKVVLDLWHHRDGLLQPMQAKRAEALRTVAVDCAYHVAEQRLVVLGDDELDRVAFITPDGSKAIAHVDMPYRHMISWDGSYHDVYVVNTLDGSRHKVLEKLRGSVSASPGGRYLVWFGEDRHWHSLDVAARSMKTLTASLRVPLVDEEWDQPGPARSHGTSGWLDDDAAILVNDRFDIWKIAPGGDAATCITDGYGRANHVVLRRVRLDPEEESIDPKEPLLLSSVNEDTMATGYFRDTLDGVGKPQLLVTLDKAFGGLTKPDKSARLFFTLSTFAEFPDLWTSDPDFGNRKRLSDANPQQRDVHWGRAEMVEWRSSDGLALKGVLVKPDDFDPTRKYPLMVYIYEERSQGLHRYQPPSPGTSPNASYYVSNGYLWFEPDIRYTVGHPGESCFKCVMPGIQALMAAGFVDENAIGIAGHSWGGYQTAYLATRTDLFKAIESGAPVCNMVSAYGGIRWSTGMSRQFQYEKTQSRIGGTLWDYPMRYLENSPIFRADMVTDPILMLHNDQDGAVPWYQGIEYFTALRRLGKEVYLFNYVGEDHGLRKRANMKDWTVRMQQFFDHHLRGAEAPAWVKEGVPFIDRDKEKIRSTPRPMEASATIETESQERER